MCASIEEAYTKFDYSYNQITTDHNLVGTVAEWLTDYVDKNVGQRAKCYSIKKRRSERCSGFNYIELIAPAVCSNASNLMTTYCQMNKRKAKTSSRVLFIKTKNHPTLT